MRDRREAEEVPAKTAKKNNDGRVRALHIRELSFACPSKRHHVLFDEGSIDKTRASEKEEYIFEPVFFTESRKWLCTARLGLNGLVYGFGHDFPRPHSSF